MTYPRSRTISKTEDGRYHVISKTVRGAYLLTSNDVYDYRKMWILDKMIFLANIFYVGTISYALMDNHMHIVLETKYQIADKAPDEDIAFRWLYLHPMRKIKEGESPAPTRKEINEFISDKKRVKIHREKLRDISCYMQELNQSIARRANKEDNVSGRFWQGRFKCINLAQPGSLLKCVMYVELNPVRAKMVDSPELSEFTSCYKRAKAEQAREKLENKPNNKKLQEEAKLDSWLSPIFNTKKKRGILEMTFKEYLELLDWTGRQIADGKRGAIPTHLKPILERLKLKSDDWIDSFKSFRKDFHTVAASEEKMREIAEKVDVCWFHGISAASRHFV
jgi:REP element-mobilizing transposase RayT